MDFNQLNEPNGLPVHFEDQAGRILWANQAELNLLGYESHEYLGRHFAEFYVDQAVANRIYDCLDQQAAVQNIEARLRSKDGTVKYVEISASVHHEDGGQFAYTRVQNRDVTADKVASEVQARLSAIVESSDDAIVSKTLDGTIVTWNAGATRIFGYTAEEIIGKSIRTLFPPERLHEETDFLQRLSRGEHIDHFETVRVRKDGQLIDISVTLSPIRNAEGQIVGASKIARDITKRKRSEQRINLLLELAAAFSQAVTSKQVAEVIVQRAAKALDGLVGVVGVLVEQGNVLQVLGLHGLSPESAQQYQRTPLAFRGPLNDAVRENRIVWIENQQDYLEQYPQFAEVIRQRGTRAIISLPLRLESRMIGGFSLSFPVTKKREPDEENFFQTLAHLCAQSLERTRLYEAERRERRFAEALRDTIAAMSSTWDLSDVFNQILENVDHVVQHDVADIMLIDGDVARIVRSHRYAQHGLVAHEEDMQKFSLKIADTYHMQWVAEHKRPAIIHDTRSDHTWIKVHDPDLIRSLLIVPIVIQNRIVGFLNVNRFTPNYYTPHDGQRLQTFADYAAIAIRNARLHQHALEMAALDERQRIARDLHDSVSQTLFSANIIAEMLPRLWESQHDKALAQTQLLQQMTRGAVAEMRVLLVELRPENLVKTHLADLIPQLAYAILGRQDIQLTVNADGMQNHLLPPDVQVAFYRIAQESLNNIIKHGWAKHVQVHLTRTRAAVKLTISDDGQGFDTGQLAGGMGMKSMRERATSIKAALKVSSRIGEGTRVQLLWKPPTAGPSAD